MIARGFLLPCASFAVLAIVILSSVALGQQEPPAFEAVSKDDARAWFSMTRERWREKVRENVAAGTASALEAEETGVAMVTRSAAGNLLVIRPLYLRGLERPDAVHVTVHYRGAAAAQFTDTMVEQALSAARRALAPEFELNDGIERSATQLLVVLEILEKMPE